MGMSGPVNAGPTQAAGRPAQKLAPPRLQRAAAETACLAGPGPRWSFGNLAIWPKLTIGAVDDPLEHEADRVADQAMRMTEVVPPRVADASRVAVRRRCAACQEEEATAQRALAGPATAVGPAPPSVAAVLRGPGQPLDPGARAFFEPRFGRDLGGVRVHADAAADLASRSIGARAFTVADHIAFAGGEYAPGSAAGRSLLAHELTHVLQQGGERYAAGSAGPAPSVRRVAAPLVQRATRKGCLAPSFVVDVATASAFGTLAEVLVNDDYIGITGGTPMANVFLDNPIGPLSYIAFLAAHHPSLDKVLLAGQIGLSGGVLVPDILDTRPGAGGVPEFYDVKPDLPDGRAAGHLKLAAIDAFMGFNKLPYGRGSSYTPAPALPIPLGGAALTAAITALLGPAGPTAAVAALACGLPVVTLAPKRIEPGLIAYQICVEADLDCYLKVLALEALIAAVILAALATAGGSVPETVPALVPAFAPLLAAASPAPAAGPAAADASAATAGSTQTQPA